MNKDRLRALMNDFKRYAFTLLAVSVFLYIGVVLPKQAEASINNILLMITTSLFLIASFIFFQKSLQYKRQLDKIEENEEISN
ncbi:YrhC family protein [Metabacillus fastidiosus]|uniref:YrhC family protein n=1 Tax=Metabacillus fastidiosus TaxID=1458 RepID=UPI002E1BF4A9|nr:YrhC family protein [Metabacillus fastidiosus]